MACFIMSACVYVWGWVQAILYDNSMLQNEPVWKCIKNTQSTMLLFLKENVIFNIFDRWALLNPSPRQQSSNHGLATVTRHDRPA